MKIHLIELDQIPIMEQLRLEEALLRLDDRNICVINTGSTPAIVMGISGKPDLLLDKPKIIRDNIPVIKRFSGGGTVVVDPSTLFVSFIFQKETHNFPLFPEPIYRWSEDFYKKAWKHPEFTFRENDYVLGNTKCGGNAQYIRKNRFLHHTTFLWDYSPSAMEYLLLPPKSPPYRKDRPHSEFLCKLKDHFPSKKSLTNAIIAELSTRYEVIPLNPDDLLPLLEEDHRKSTTFISME